MPLSFSDLTNANRLITFLPPIFDFPPLPYKSCSNYSAFQPPSSSFFTRVLIPQPPPSLLSQPLNHQIAHLKRTTSSQPFRPRVKNYPKKDWLCGIQWRWWLYKPRFQRQQQGEPRFTASSLFTPPPGPLFDPILSPAAQHDYTNTSLVVG